MKSRSASGIWLLLTVTVFVGGGLLLPILGGLWETILPAFGYLSAIDAENFSLAPWQRLFSLPGFGTSLLLTLKTGFAATILSLSLAVGVHATIRRGVEGFLPRFLAPILATPHAALAIGFAFLIAPSGWVLRLLSPAITGFEVPPNVALVHDPHGIGLAVAMALKEAPFLIFISAAALRQIPVEGLLNTGRSLGYSRTTSWLKLVLPQLYPQIRLPVYVVLAFSLSVIDAAIILGPNNPPPLAVQTLRWFSAPDIEMLLPAAASAILQAGIVVISILIWRVAEILTSLWARHWAAMGKRRSLTDHVAQLFGSSAIILLATAYLSLLILAIWSVAWRWRFPEALPTQWSLENWTKAASTWAPALLNSFTIAIATTLLSLILVIAWLEAGERSGILKRLLPAITYWPLILPQSAFMFGLHIVSLKVGLNASLPMVIWAHSLFVFPYLMLTLSDPWNALDPRYARAASSMGHDWLSILIRVKLPLLLGPVLAASAVGFAVSIAQYLPTLVIGEGRIVTLTTEAVARSSSGDRRLVAVFASLQTVLPFIAYGLALYLPRLTKLNRMAAAKAPA